MVGVGSSLRRSDQIFVHVECRRTTGVSMAEGHDDVPAHDLKIHVGDLDRGTRAA
jgi:hypothetical protein